MPEDFSSPPPPPIVPPQAPPATGGYPPPPFGYSRTASPYASVPPNRRSAWFYVGVIGGSFAAIVLVISLMAWGVSRSFRGDEDAGGFGRGKSIGVIEITGVILDAEKIDSQLRKFGDDSSVKAILLHINSPGGGAAASQEIYHEVLRIRQEKHKKIIASVESVGASGAYYIASACDRIYANDASVVGSIGVIMEWTNYGELLRWAKLKNVTITKGELKDAGDPSRDITPKEQAYFQSLVDNMYTQFVHDVATARHTTDEKIVPLATGQVWTGEQSLPLGLIDKVGGFRVALIETAREAGISGEPRVVRPSRDKKGLVSILTSDGEDLFPNPSQLLNRAPGFYYMWK